jgi:hypothetical protein
MWQTIKREELYEEVWSTPLTQLGAKYGLSDNGLRKVCKRLNVPIPWRGYWAKIEAGHRVKKTPLPAIAQRSTTEFWRAPKRENTEEDCADAEWFRERAAYEANPAHAIEMIEKPRRWHTAIAPLKEALELEVKEVEASRKAQEQYDKWPEWRKQRESGPDRMAWLWYERAGQLMPATHHATVVRLSLAQWRRGLAILNAVAVAATKRGFAVTHDSKKGRVVLVGHAGELELRMSEATEQKTRKVKRYDGKMEDERYRVPTGRLRIFVERGYGKVWTFEETAESPLEARLNAFFAGVWKQVALCREKAREEEAGRTRDAALAAERAEAARIEREAAARREAEQKRRDALLEEVAAWRRANEIRAYVAAVKEATALRGDEAVADWVEWALGVAGEVDPVGQRVRTGVAAI